MNSKKYEMDNISYPVSWILTSTAHLIGFAVVFRLVKRKSRQ